MLIDKTNEVKKYRPPIPIADNFFHIILDPDEDGIYRPFFTKINSIISSITPDDEKITDSGSSLLNKIITKVKVGGTLIETIDNTVDIPIAKETILGVVKGSSDENSISINDDGSMEINTININKIIQSAGDVLILNSGGSEVFST